jgi:hypothetical protein
LKPSISHHDDFCRIVRRRTQEDASYSSRFVSGVLCVPIHCLLTFCSAPKPKFATVLVGESEEPFVVHEHLLTHHSEFFRAALTGGFKESKDKVVKLHETDPFIFECFVHWLYYQRFPSASKGDDETLVQSWEATSEDGILTTNLIKMYILADSRIVPALQRQVVDRLFRRIHEVDLPTRDDVVYAFENLKSNSPLCRFLVDVGIHYGWYDANGIKQSEAKGHEHWPAEYLFAFACRATEVVMNMIMNDNHFCLDKCDYHEHRTDKEREECREDLGQYY